MGSRIDCPGLVAVDGVCTNCGRPTATYLGREQHRRGGSWQSRDIGRPRRLTKTETLALLPERIDRLEAFAADQLLAGEAMRLQIAELMAAIEGFMARQPIVLEVRPRHDRQADGGKGGREETRSTQRTLRKVVGA